MINHNTFVIERNYPAAIEKVFAALSDPCKKRAWFAESANHDVESFEMNFHNGGRERISYRMNATTPFPGAQLVSDGSYLDIVPNMRIVMAQSMAFGDKPFSAALATFELVPTENGTNLFFTHQGAFFEGADGPEMREGGWRHLLGRLAEYLAA
jgi:uncharacterized protein YndB with AHSA1/START domain